MLHEGLDPVIQTVEKFDQRRFRLHADRRPVCLAGNRIASAWLLERYESVSRYRLRISESRHCDVIELGTPLLTNRCWGSAL
jgi:hypothetical protein